MIKALILMAGEGKRFADPIPKQFHLLYGKKVYLHTLERMQKIPDFAEILLVCPSSQMEEISHEVRHLPRVRLVAGGSTRQESSYLGLLACGPDTHYVVIHDGVRPFVSEAILRANIEGAKQFGAVDTCIPSADTLVYAPTGTRIEAIPNRAHLYRGQTPQSFAYPLILEAHRQATTQTATDDCSLVLALGKEVHLVQGEESNIKITTPLDLLLATKMIDELDYSRSFF